MAELDDLFTALLGKLGDMGVLCGKSHLGLEPAVGFLAGHQPVLPELLQRNVCVSAFTPQTAVGKGAHGHLVEGVGFHIGIAEWVSGTDVVFFTVIDRAVFIQDGRRTKERLRAAVGAFDIGSFHKTSFGRM